MITIHNYMSEVNRIGVNNLPEALAKSHAFFLKSTNHGNNLEVYNTNETIHKVIDLYLSKLNAFVSTHKETKSQSTPETKSPAPYPKARHSAAEKSEKANRKHDPDAVHHKEQKPAKRVGHIREEIKYIKRYVGLHNKVKSPNAILSFIKALQRSIVQKLISKTSPVAQEIEMIQDNLVKTYNKMNKGDLRIEINQKDLGKLVALAGGEEVYSSIRFIKRFIGMQERDLHGKQVESFIKQLKNAVTKKKIMRDDPYADKLQAIYKKLSSTAGKIPLTQAELSGLEGIVKACGCKKHINKISRIRATKQTVPNRKKQRYPVRSKVHYNHSHELSGVLTAEQMASRKFDLLDFQGQWLSLFGKPSVNFTLMFHGEPGSGKTTLLLTFAKYLADNFGEVLYISSEEFASVTMTKKINELVRPFPPRLHFAENLNPDLSKYDFIILDSINDLGLKIDDYKTLREANPDKAFILVLQHNKGGQFKGGKEWEHTLEIAGEIDNGVVTITKNRYGPLTSLNFFDSQQFPTEATRIY